MGLGDILLGEKKEPKRSYYEAVNDYRDLCIMQLERRTSELSGQLRTSEAELKICREELENERAAKAQLEELLRQARVEAEREQPATPIQPEPQPAAETMQDSPPVASEPPTMAQECPQPEEVAAMPEQREEPPETAEEPPEPETAPAPPVIPLTKISLAERAAVLDALDSLAGAILIGEGFFENENAAKSWFRKNDYVPAPKKKRIRLPNGREARRWTKNKPLALTSGTGSESPPASGSGGGIGGGSEQEEENTFENTSEEDTGGSE